MALQTVIITGACGGIGRELVNEYKRANFHVIAIDSRPKIDELGDVDFLEFNLATLVSDNESKMLYVGDKEIYEKVTGESTNGESDYNRFLGIEGWDNADSKSDLYFATDAANSLSLKSRRETDPRHVVLRR